MASCGEAGRAPGGAALLRLACELRYHAVQLPNLDIVAVSKLPGGLDGCGIIRTIQINSLPRNGRRGQ